MATKNILLTNARTNKNDEFYTQLTDIEKEIVHYKKHFKDKVVLCNCDDPHTSQFFYYFLHQFETLGLKKLITACYKNQQMKLFSNNESEKAVWLEYNGYKNNNRVPDPEEIGIHNLKGDGDFRSQECIDLLKRADIIVSNPPFSLFREYVAQLVKYDKKFLIIGNVNAIGNKEMFPLIKNNKVWLGKSIHSGGREFMVPKDYKITTKSCSIDEYGNRFVEVAGVRWFTNLDYGKRYEDIILYKKYTPEEYPKYDNYDAININKTKEIPVDYDGVMGVPITFIDKFNPDQFEILGLDRSMDCNPNYGHRFQMNGRETYARILIKNKRHIK